MSNASFWKCRKIIISQFSVYFFCQKVDNFEQGRKFFDIEKMLKMSKKWRKIFESIKRSKIWKNYNTKKFWKYQKFRNIEIPWKCWKIFRIPKNFYNNKFRFVENVKQNSMFPKYFRNIFKIFPNNILILSDPFGIAKNFQHF